MPHSEMGMDVSASSEMHVLSGCSIRTDRERETDNEGATKWQMEHMVSHQPTQYCCGSRNVIGAQCNPSSDLFIHRVHLGQWVRLNQLSSSVVRALIREFLEASVPSGDLHSPMSLPDFLLCEVCQTLPLTLLWLCVYLSPPRPICPRTPLGFPIHPEKPRLVVAQLPPRTSGSPAAPRPSTPSAPPGSSFPPVSPASSLIPLLPSAEFLVSTSIMRASHSTLGFQAFSVTLVYQPFCSAGSSTLLRSTFTDQLPSATQSFGQSSTLVTPTVGFMVLVFSDSSRFQVLNQHHALH
ncbi:IgA FC receptor [Labeo rohita]|uniref:IgA FC receptor n=1 Tax=Labeo rohita TaxID=84645 RepID=A0ABQ8LTL2_LABRO|nr:IgA FC receptor [Labeo rohita]